MLWTSERGTQVIQILVFCKVGALLQLHTLLALGREPLNPKPYALRPNPRTLNPKP